MNTSALDTPLPARPAHRRLQRPEHAGAQFLRHVLRALARLDRPGQIYQAIGVGIGESERHIVLDDPPQPRQGRRILSQGPLVLLG